MRYFALILLTATCFAQTQGNAPELLDSYQSDTLGATAGQIAYPEPIVAGNELVFCININATAATPTVTDSLGNTWTMTAGTTAPAPQANRTVYMAYTHSAFSGADTISYSNPGALAQTASVGRFTGLSGVLDGSVVTATYVGNTGVGGGVGTFNTSATTTVNNSLGVSCAGMSAFGTSNIGPSSNTEMVSFNQETNNAQSFMSMTRTTSAGTYTPTFSTYNDFSFGSHATFMAQTIFFKPAATIAIGDTVLPHALNGTAYSYTLHCIGGTAAQTYSLFSGSFPSGITLNTSTGVISGTTTSIGASSLQFKCTDGTNTSAAQAITFTVDSTAGLPTVQQSATFETGSGTFNSPVACGDLIAIYFYGADTHGNNGWIWPQTSATSVTFSDTLGTTFNRVSPLGATNQAGYQLYIGQAPSSGSETVTFSHTGAQAGSGLSSVMVDIANAQIPVDNGTMSSAGTQASSPYSFTNSLTTVVPNQLLLVAAASNSQNDTISLSPMSVGQSNAAALNSAALGWQLVTSPSSTTATATITTTQPNSNFGEIVMAGIRPGVAPAGCSRVTGGGEKIRRVVW